jgi:ribosomal protein L11 methyltransferase
MNNNIKEFYYELEVKPSLFYDNFLDLLIDIYSEGFEELDNSFILRSEKPFDNIIWTLNLFKDKLSQATNQIIELDIKETQKKNIDWIENFKKSVKPILIKPFYIHQSWNSNNNNYQNIVLDPALAFGSGHHETTSSCVELLIDEVVANKRVLDVGTGSGILSLIIAKIGGIVDFCDIDSIAIDSAKENFTKNNLNFKNSWIGSADKTNESYDLVVANIIPDVIIHIKEHLKNRINKNGKLILSGILNTQAKRVLDEFQDFTLLKTINKNEWVTILLKK